MSLIRVVLHLTFTKGLPIYLPHLQLPSSLCASSSLVLHIQHFFLFFCTGLSSGRKGSATLSASFLFSPPSGSVFSRLLDASEEGLVLVSTAGTRPSWWSRLLLEELFPCPPSTLAALLFCMNSVGR